MSGISASNFRVISHDDYGKPVRCSYCARNVLLIVVLPLTQQPELDERIASSNDNDLWVGLCSDCVDAMRFAIERGEAS